MLGASGKDILFLAAAETGLLTVIAVPAGCVVSFFMSRWLGFRLEMSFRMLAGIQIWLAVLSCCCGVLPVWRALRRPLQLSGAGYIDVPMYYNRAGVLGRKTDVKNGHGKSRTYFFAGFMSKKYYLADRRRHRRITFTILAAVLLYVPAAYRGECRMTVWLCQIAKHLYFAAGKKQKRRQDFAAFLGKMPQEFSSPHMLERLLCDEEDAMRIHALLHQMEEPYKEIFMLRVFGELPFKKIACIFGKTENWARVTYHRAKLKIISEMEESNGKDIM